MRIIQKLTSWSDACVSLPGLSSQHLRLVQRTAVKGGEKTGHMAE